MLEECGLPYKAHPIVIGKGEQFQPWFLKISPNNKTPAMIDRDGPGGKEVTLFESGAILFYLAEKSGRFFPADAGQALRLHAVADVPDVERRPHARPGARVLQIRPRPSSAREARGRHRALRAAGQPALQRDGPASRGPRMVRRGRIHHRRHGGVSVAADAVVPRRRDRRISERQALARQDRRAAGGAARARGAQIEQPLRQAHRRGMGHPVRRHAIRPPRCRGQHRAEKRDEPSGSSSRPSRCAPSRAICSARPGLPRIRPRSPPMC